MAEHGTRTTYVRARLCARQTERGSLARQRANIHKHVRQPAISYSTAAFLALARRKAATGRGALPTGSYAAVKNGAYRLFLRRPRRIRNACRGFRTLCKPVGGDKDARKIDKRGSEQMRPDARARARSVSEVYRDYFRSARTEWTAFVFISASVLGQRPPESSLKRLMRFYFFAAKIICQTRSDVIGASELEKYQDQDTGN